MPRIRTIKPEFWKDYELATTLSRDARLLYIGMWNFSDDHGVIEGPAERIKAEIFPYETVNIRKLLSELIHSKRALEYSVQDSTYFWLPKLSKNQRIDRPRDSNLPLPSDEIIRNHMISNEISCSRARAVGEGKVGDKEGNSNPSLSDERGMIAASNGHAPVWGTPEALITLYNAETPDECPAVDKLTEARRKKCKQYLAQFPDQEFWRECFKRIHGSMFLRGLKPSPGHTHFRASLDWLLSKGRDGVENAVKTWEGRYGEE